LQDELADIEAEAAAYEEDLVTYRAKAMDHDAMSAKIDNEWNEIEAKCSDLENRRRKFEADSAAYTAMRARFDTKSDEHNAEAEQLEAIRVDLEMRHMSFTRRREIVRQSQSRIGHLKNADQSIPHSQTEPSTGSQQGTPQFQQIRAEVREVIGMPGEALQQLGFAPVPSTG